jgi:hypothetical protein
MWLDSGANSRNRPERKPSKKIPGRRQRAPYFGTWPWTAVNAQAALLQRLLLCAKNGLAETGLSARVFKH